MSKKNPRPRKPGNPVVTSEAPQKLELTAYQGGQAVVRECRVVSLAKGRNLVNLAGLPSQFVPGSLTVDTVEGKGQFKLGPNSFRPATLNQQAMLQASVGCPVTIIEQTPQGQLRTSGKLLHLIGNQVVLEVGGAVQVLPLSNKFELADGVPEGLCAVPSLQMEPTVSDSGEYGVNILYETGGIGWQSRYEAFYDAAAEKLTRLSCWVDITNNSGARLEEARFKLIAASNHGRGRQNYGLEAAPMAMMASGGARSAKAAPQADFAVDNAEAESVGEQKLFVLPEALSLDNGETKHAILMLGTDVPVRPEYYLSEGYYGDGEATKEEDLPKLPIHVRLRLTNDKSSNLGTALPPGAVSVFERDSAGSLQKTDSAKIQHVAADEAFKLELTNCSKDLKATRRLVDSKQDPEPPEDDEETMPVRPLGGAEVGTPEAHSRTRRDAAEGAGKKKQKKPAPRYREEERQVTIQNYKDKDVEVLVSESYHPEAEFLRKSQDFAEQAHGSGLFRVQVPAKGKATITYRIKFRIN